MPTGKSLSFVRYGTESAHGNENHRSNTALLRRLHHVVGGGVQLHLVFALVCSVLGGRSWLGVIAPLVAVRLLLGGNLHSPGLG